MSAKRIKPCSEETQTEEKTTSTDENQTKNPEPSIDKAISDLPLPIFVDILLKLSTRTITLCKTVCKAWLGAISDPEFAEAHLAQAKTYPLVRDTLNYRVSRSVYLLEPEDGLGFHPGYCWCGSMRCGLCRVNVKVESRLKLPLRNFREMLGLIGEGEDVSDVIFDLTRYIKRKNLIKLGAKPRYMYKISNSCRGLLCLSVTFGNDPIIVCNPVTGEFMECPLGPRDEHLRFKFCALGFSPRDGRFKVVKLLSPFTTADVHTLGTCSWRSFDVSGLELDFLSNAVFLNGAVHWIFHEPKKDSVRIVSFDFDEETFRAVPVPSPPCQRWKNPCLAVGVLGDRLCVYETFICDKTDIWVMKEYGVSESWTKLCSVDVPANLGAGYCGCYQPLSYLHDGAMMMFHNPANQLVFYDRLGAVKFKCLNFCGIKSEFEAIAHTPSFISIKEIVKDTNIEVLNVNSRCGNLKLVEETYPLMLGRSKK